jgi:hypothetical protein
MEKREKFKTNDNVTQITHTYSSSKEYVFLPVDSETSVGAARGIRIGDVTLLEVQGCGRLRLYDLRHSCGGINKGHWDI